MPMSSATVICTWSMCCRRPERLEDRVGEAEREEVLHGLLPEVVVDAVDLRLGERLQQAGVQRAGAGEIDAERLLHDDARDAPLRRPIQAGLREQLRGDREVFRRDREVEEAAARRFGARLPLQLLDLFRQGAVPLRIVQLRRVVMDAREEGSLLLVVGLAAGELAERVARLLADFVVGELAPAACDDGGGLGEEAVRHQVEEGWGDLPLVEVARRAKHDDRPRLLGGEVGGLRRGRREGVLEEAGDVADAAGERRAVAHGWKNLAGEEGLFTTDEHG
jgi:hypothetical protein